ncbi:MAG: Stf0 family sulfotransferase [Pseudomonadales bacterium]|nr:Stf0 family sulfotransferase [Pseudomonadales bacterium]
MDIQISTKNRLEMSPDRDFEQQSEVRQRYCILSSPRSGSTLLSRMLFDTGAAGDPLEYLNPPLLLIERERSGRPNLDWGAFLNSMEARRTSPNGVFGMKLHYHQLIAAAGTANTDQNVTRFLELFDQFIWIRRRDRLRQAISLAIALKSQKWSVEDTDKSIDLVAADISDHEIVTALNTVVADDLGWEGMADNLPCTFQTVWYEDLVSDFDTTGHRVMEYLNLQDQINEIPEPRLERQATALNEELRERFLEFLAVS